VDVLKSPRRPASVDRTTPSTHPRGPLGISTDDSYEEFNKIVGAETRQHALRAYSKHRELRGKTVRSGSICPGSLGTTATRFNPDPPIPDRDAGAIARHLNGFRRVRSRRLPTATRMPSRACETSIRPDWEQIPLAAKFDPGRGDGVNLTRKAARANRYFRSLPRSAVGPDNRLASGDLPARPGVNRS